MFGCKGGQDRSPQTAAEEACSCVTAYFQRPPVRLERSVCEEAGSRIPAETRKGSKGAGASVGGTPAGVCNPRGNVSISHSLEQRLCGLQKRNLQRKEGVKSCVSSEVLAKCI